MSLWEDPEAELREYRAAKSRPAAAGAA